METPVNSALYIRVFDSIWTGFKYLRTKLIIKINSWLKFNYMNLLVSSLNILIFTIEGKQNCDGGE